MKAPKVQKEPKNPKAQRLKKISTTNIKKGKKLSSVEDSDKINIPDECSAIVFSPNGNTKVYVSNKSNEDSSVYLPHEELAIALAGLIQNPVFVEQALKTFHKLFDEAVQKNLEIQDTNID